MTTHFSLSKHVHLQQHVLHVALQLHQLKAFCPIAKKVFYVYFPPQPLEQRRQRPTPQPYRTEARKRSRRQRNWRKAWRLYQPMTPPPPQLLHPPSHKVAHPRAHPPSLHRRRKRSSSRHRFWKRARSRRRKQRPEAYRHPRPRWNTTVKYFLVCGAWVADGLNHIRCIQTVQMSFTDTVY